MKRKHKIYSRPKRPFEKERILNENRIKEKFGLKNKREIWKAEAKIKQIRRRAKELISSPREEQKKLFEQLEKIGINVNSIADILALQKEDYLKRRLQTILVNKGLATTPKSARQLITHKKVLIEDKVVNIPSYIVPIKLENKIKLREIKKKQQREKIIETLQKEEEIENG
jgi:small subunit ribosomal protein S4